MFHVEIRRFPHLTYGLNLTREQLATQILRPWTGGAPFDYNDKRWDPARAKLTIYEGRELRPEELGLGRGWANATRTGKDVTAELLTQARTPPPVQELKDELLARLAGANAPIPMLDAVELATDKHPHARPSERLGLAEQAVWELLHERRVALVDRDGQALEQSDWQATVLSWEAWADQSPRLAPI